MPTGGFTQDGAELLFNLLRGTASPPAALYMGLAETAIAADDTLATIDEVTATGYARQETAFGAPTGLDPVQIANSAGELFGPLTSEPPPVAYGFITDAASGTSGIIIFRFTDDPEDAEINESLEVALGACVMAIDTTEAGL